MRIYSMTATFGKLEHDTLTLKPGLNILHAPNEWGKSTWCAFLVAMLYGIETKERTTKATIADKERYAPWSGSPMSGRIDLCWNGRDITIERSSKGRSVFGIFRAYETQTGLEIPELRADNCGQLLLGVEKSVFLRAGFLRLTDLPVTQDEALRRRLNALVTTGDESGTADALALKLKELKNRCRANRVSGLLPQAEAQRADLEGKLAELRALESQSGKLQLRQKELEVRHGQLKNHQAALEYEENRAYARKLTEAAAQEAAARAQLEKAQVQCQGLPEADAAEQRLLRLDQLQSALTALQMDAQLLPEAPKAPDRPNVFRELEALDVRQLAANDEAAHAQAEQEAGRKLPMILGIVLGLLSLALVLIPHWAGILGAAVGVLAGIALVCVNLAGRKKAKAAALALEEKYRPLAPGQWAAAAAEAVARHSQYTRELAAYEAERAGIAQRAQTLKQALEQLTGGTPLAQCRQEMLDIRDRWLALSDARKEHHRAAQLTQTLGQAHREVEAPAFPDGLTFSAQETARLISDCAYEQRQLHEQLGRCRGRMEALGSADNLQKQLEAVNGRIAQLNDTYAALEIAQATLSAATAELQRRFAPRIAQRAQVLFSKLTDGRYTRLTLADDLTVHAGAQNEDTLHSALWRSDGTMDQLYLALRLAVAEEVTPQAPLILDDALVRFDDQRLGEAIDLLLEAADQRQVLLFTCQKREQEILHRA